MERRRNSVAPQDQEDWPLLRSKTFLTIVVIILLLILYFGVWQGLWGNIYYDLEYIRAALGNDAVGTACARVKAVKNPWYDLDQEGWWTLQKCLGNEDGFRRQGELMALFVDRIKYLLSFLGPLPTLGAIGAAFYYIVTHGPEHVERSVGVVRHTSPNILARIVFGLLTLALGAVWLFWSFKQFLLAAAALSVVALGLLTYHFYTETPSRAWQVVTTMMRPAIDFIVLVASQASPYLLSILKPVHHIFTSLYYFRTCHHIQDCQCPTVDELNVLCQARNTLMDDLHRSIKNNQPLRERVRQQADEIRILQGLPPNPTDAQRQIARQAERRKINPEAWKEGPINPNPQPLLSPKSREHRNEVERLQDVIYELERHQLSQEKKYETRISNMKAQLGYAKGDGNVLQTKEEVVALRTALQNKDKELNHARHLAMRNKLELENERNTVGSRACKNEASCQALIKRLQNEKYVLLKTHRDNDLMVQEAAREFGKSEEEARHYTVRSYLQELTQAMVLQIAAGGLGNVRDQPVFANILNNMDRIRLKELESYKNRLEDEVERLGGNLQFVKMGLNIRLPPNKLLHFKGLENVVFEVYLGLCDAVKLFTDVFVKDVGPYGVIPWDHPQPRNETSNRRIHIQVLDMFDQQLKVVKNLKYEQYERLIYSLLQQEIARLFGRLLDLKREAVENKKHVLSPMSIQVLEGKSKDISTTIRVALGFMSDQREVEKSDIPLSDPIMGFKADLRYKIWIAMQEAIHHLQQALLSFNTIPPLWRIPEGITAPSFLPTKTFPDLVTRVLKFEINVLDDRITQLLEFMERERLPGTTAGQPRIAGPPKYQADFDALTAAITYANLCKGHWWDQLYPDQVGRPRLPLDHPPLLHAVRRETGDILVPNVNPFPWKLQIDGRLQDARIVEPASQDPNNELTSQIVLDSGIHHVTYKFPPVPDSEIDLKQDAQGNLIFGDLESEKRWYEKYYDRRRQLVNWCNVSGKGLPYNVGTWTHGKEGPNMGLIKAKKRELAESVRDLTAFIMANNLGVPEWPYKGGKMEPDVEMKGT